MVAFLHSRSRVLCVVFCATCFCELQKLSFVTKKTVLHLVEFNPKCNISDVLGRQ
jgi:hypothetical protein